MTRLTSQPSLGCTNAGVRYATAPRRDLRIHVGAYAPTGVENAPLVPMDDVEPLWVRYARWIATGLGAILLIVLLGMVAINAAYPS